MSVELTNVAREKARMTGCTWSILCGKPHDTAQLLLVSKTILIEDNQNSKKLDPYLPFIWKVTGSCSS